MNSISKSIFRTLLIGTWAVWFGGFMFYVSFVVPIGTEVLGSARAQGFITRLVTHRINWMCLATLALMAVELVTSWRWSSKLVRGFQLSSVLVIAMMLAVLMMIHPLLDQLIDLERQQIRDRAEFYQLHRVYLWASTLQWAFGFVWLLTVLRNWQVEFRYRNGGEQGRVD